jgi:hypothetical protein
MKHSTLGVSDFQFLHAFRRLLPPALLRRAVAATSPVCRRDRHCPAWLVLGCLVAWFFYARAKLPFIARWLCRRGPALPSDSALYQTRRGLGWAPLRWLLRHLLRPLALAPEDAWGYYRGHRLLALDGTTLTAADSPANHQAFGRAGNQHGPSGYPLLRLAALCEVGSHALLAWVARAFRVSEQVLAARLYRAIPRGALVLADRNFHSYPLWAAAGRGAWGLLLRVQKGPRFPVAEVYADGSFRSHILPRRGKRKRARAIPVRVIVYGWTDERGREQTARLVTGLLDAACYPAAELVTLYHRRWEQEGAFREIKGELAGRPMHLRCQRPLGVMAELDGLLLGHYVVRGVIVEAAREAGVPPVTISFAGALRILRTRLAGMPAGAAARRRWGRELRAVIGRERLAKRRERRCPRQRKVTRSRWPVNKGGGKASPLPTFKVRAPAGP